MRMALVYLTAMVFGSGLAGCGNEGSTPTAEANLDAATLPTDTGAETMGNRDPDVGQDLDASFRPGDPSLPDAQGRMDGGDAAPIVCDPPPPVSINEVVASNVTGLTDEDGDTPDWIELYNAGPEPAALGGWGLSDDRDEPFKWVLPDMNLEPGEFLLILASKKDRRSVVATWETRVDWGDLWRYLPVLSPPDPNWAQPDFDDSGWASGPSGFGHADGDDATEVPGHTVYIRRTVRMTPEELNDLTFALLHVDFDDAFVAYLNGVEVARSSIGTPGIPPAWDQFADASHEAVLIRGGQPELYDITEAFELFVPGDNVLAIEQHDINPQSSDTSLIPFLSLGYSTQRPGSASEHLILPGRNLHTNFAISAAGETITLTLPDGCEVDRLETGALPANVSIGRSSDGSADMAYFMTPTPGESNTTESRDRFAQTPTLTPPPGFHPEGVSVTIESDVPSATIHFTRDGSEPDPSDPQVEGPVVLGPDREVAILRARAYEEGAWPSAMVTGTYFIEPASTLPTLSLTTEPANLFDQETGIYVFGDTYEPNIPFIGANFWEDWERPLHVEFWEPGGAPGFTVDCGVKIHGGWSRSQPQKSLRFMMRAGYGADAIEYPVFGDDSIETFERLILRNSGNDWHGCSERGCTSGSHLRDAVMHRMARGLDLELLASRPAVTYLNGVYWGIYNIRERSDRQYLTTHLGVEEVDVLEFGGGVVEGDGEHYQGLLEIFRTEDMSSPETYARVQARVDTDNFATYQIMQIFYGNHDWPGNNIKFWRPRTPDGRWRWLMFDSDFGLGGVREPRRGPSAGENTLAFALRPDGPSWPNPPWSTEPLRAMVQNPQFRVDFINRYADYLNTRLKPEFTRPIVAEAAATIAAEIPRHTERWGRIGERNGPRMQAGVWENQIERMHDWLEARPGFARNHIVNTFGLAGMFQLDLQVDPPGSGTFELTGVTVESPFTGTYFIGVPVTVTARPTDGYEWRGWLPADVPQEQTIVVSPQGATSLTARFE